MQVKQILEQNRGNYVSGELIAQYFGISRAAIWKQIQKLRNEGYMIDADRGKGYRLRDDNDTLSEEAVISFLRDPNCHIIVQKSVTSTNDILKQIAAEGAPERTVLIAEEQTKGKGRRGRNFYSPQKEGIYMSLLLRPQMMSENALLLSALSACAVHDAIKEITNLECEIKWVNDLYYKEKKICGILCEGSCSMETNEFDYVIIGIGINCSNEVFPEELKNIAGSLKDAHFIRAALAASVIRHFFRYYDLLPNHDFLNTYRKASCVIGKPITIYQGNRIESAIAVDIDDNGYLMIKQNGKRSILNSGEITIRLNQDKR